MALPVTQTREATSAVSNNKHDCRRHLTQQFMQTAIQMIKLPNKHARMPSGYRPKPIQVQMSMEMNDAVEEEDEDESDVLRIQYAAQSSMRLSS
jgi:hypothetical protein